MSPETITAIKDALTPIFEKMGQTGTYGWEALIKGQVITGILDVALGTFFMAIAIIALAIGYKKRKEILEETDGSPFLVIAMVSIIGILLGLMNLYNGFIEIYAPEYSVIKMLATGQLK